jgi:hypothetical protein
MGRQTSNHIKSDILDKPHFQNKITNSQIFFPEIDYEGRILFPVPNLISYQTLFVKWGYNEYMGRNYFSKHGGPYFINDGFTHHLEEKPKSDNKKDIRTVVCLLLGTIGILFIVNLVIIKSFN